MNNELSFKKKKVGNARKKEQIIFYISFVTLPLLQFFIYYILVNAQSILFAFQGYDIQTGKYFFNNFKNFIDLFDELSRGGIILFAIKNSLMLYGVTLLLGTSLAVMFSYYVYKKFFGSVAFRVILYLPHIMSNVSVVSIYKYFVDIGVPYIWELFTGTKITGLLANLDTQFYTIMFLSIYLSFGNNVLIYTSSMSSISESVVESAELDGVTRLKEFWYITLPMIFPTITTFLVTGVAGIFNNQMALYTFYGGAADPTIQNLAYYIYVQTKA